MFILVLQTSSSVSTGKLGTIAVGCVGIILVSSSGIGLAAASNGHCGYKTVTNDTEVRNKTSATSQEWVCIKFTAAQLAGSLLALIGGSLMWSISSSMFNYHKPQYFQCSLCVLCEKYRGYYMAAWGYEFYL